MFNALMEVTSTHLLGNH